MESLGRDLRSAMRGLAKSKTFTAVAVVSLALGIGANTAMFTLLDQALLRRLPVEKPDEIALVRMDGGYYGSTWGSSYAISYPLYEDLSANNSEVGRSGSRQSSCLGRTFRCWAWGRPLVAPSRPRKTRPPAGTRWSS